MSQLSLGGWSTWLLVVSIGLAGGWLLLLWLVSVPGRQRPVRAQATNADLGPERGGPLGPGTMLTGNVLVVAGHGMSAAVQLNDPDAQAAGSALERFAPVLAQRLASGGQGGLDQPATAGGRAGQ